MTITSSGLMCNVCGKFIGIADPDEKYYVFTLKGSDDVMHACSDCNEPFKKAAEVGDFRLLPDGPLKNVFYEAMQEAIDENT